MDVAASEFYDEQQKKYDLNNKEPGRPNYVNINFKKNDLFDACCIGFS
jgi:enolase